MRGDFQICHEAYRESFNAFIDKGEEIQGFGAHLSYCKTCKSAVAKAFQETSEVFIRLYIYLNKKS